MGIVLRCTGGPCDGETITIEAELVLGREQSDPGRLGGDPRLSRSHARLFVDDEGRGIVEDLGSTNGTWINDERLTEPCTIETGDVLRVGRSTFECEAPVRPVATQMDTVLPAAIPTVAEAPRPEPSLLVVAGPKQGEKIPLGAELLIGRGYGEPGALGGDRRLSRRHARIARGPGGVFFIEDTGSSNGTTLNATQLRGAQSLKDGDEIEVGSSRLEARGLPVLPAALELDEMMGAVSSAPPPARTPAPPAMAPPPPPPPPAVAQTPPAPEPLAPQPPAFAPEPPAFAPQPPAFAPQPPAFEAPPAIPAQLHHYAPQGAADARLSSRGGRLVGVFAAVFALAAVAAVAVVVLVAPLGTRTCPAGFVCQKPLTAPPLRNLRTFTGSLGWRVEYDAESTVAVTSDAAGNELGLHESASFDRRALANSGGPIIAVLIRGYRAAQVSPQDAMQRLASSIESKLVGATAAPASDQLFNRPVLGFHPASGEVLEGNAQTPQGPGPLFKLAIVSAASGGVTVVMAIVYPVQLGANQGSNPDRPLDTFGDQILGTVRFPSDGAT